ncbi:MAG: S8 family serine peptidase [Bacteroidota bacterium]|jgi:Subtilase family/PKD-like domain/Secretion system C-terminal sorting domain
MAAAIYLRRALSLYMAFILCLSLNAQNQKDLEKIYSSTNRAALVKMGKHLSAESASSKQQALQVAGQKGWLTRKVFESGMVVELKGLDPKGKPVYFSTANLNAAKTVSTNKCWSGGSLGLNLNGNGIVLREWDAGEVRPNHQELIGRTVMGDGATNLADHSTHVAGTMLATGIVAAAHGMENQATLRAFDWFYDYAEMTTEAAAGALLSNHSYIYLAGWYWNGANWYWYGDPAISQTTDYYYGFYLSDAATVDSIAYYAPYYLVCKAVGNDRLGGPSTQPVTHYVWDGNNWILSNTVRDLNGGPNGWDCISSGFGVSKNIMTVGAVNPIPNGYSSPSDVVFASFSGTGPTDDGRIKPDIVADGIGLYSTLSGGNTSYGSMSGTSMATPNTCGSLGLLQQHYHNLHGVYMRASTLRGLVIHTADEAGTNPGPDYMFGWGLLNTATAANTLTQNCSNLVLEDTLFNGDTWTINLTVTGAHPLIATICWTDPPGTPPAPALNPPNLMLVNDLDMRIDGSTYKPWILDPQNVTAAATKGDNFRDNVEKIVIQNPPAGVHTLTITHKYSLSSSSQIFSLIVSGLDAPLAAGSIGSSQTICSGTLPGQLYGVPPTGSVPPYTYQWQSSANNINFSNIQGATGLNYQPGILSATTYFRQIQNAAGGCGSVTTNTITVTVMPLPVPTISGADSACAGESGLAYITEDGMNAYNWSVSANGAIASGQGTHQVLVNWNGAGNASVSVNYSDIYGCSASSPTVKNVTVDAIPPTPVITVNGFLLSSNTPAGNQWYLAGSAIPGATSQTYYTTAPGWYWDIVTLNGCASDTSNNLIILLTVDELSLKGYRVYPVPSNGMFTISGPSAPGKATLIKVCNSLGQVIFEKSLAGLANTFTETIDPGPVPSGIYTILLQTAEGPVSGKLLIQR